MKMKADEACLSCKVVSVSCLLAIGGYLFYLGKHQPKSKHVLYTLGTGNEFTTKNSNQQIKLMF